MTEKSRGPWISIVLGGVLAFVVSMIVIAVVMACYAFTLAMQTHGAPDQAKIELFANRVIPFLGPLTLSLLVLLAARIVVGRAKAPQLWHGVLLGVVAAVPTVIFGFHFSVGDVVGLLVPPASGLLGAVWARRAAGSKQ